MVFYRNNPLLILNTRFLETSSTFYNIFIKPLACLRSTYFVKLTRYWLVFLSVRYKYSAFPFYIYTEQLLLLCNFRLHLISALHTCCSDPSEEIKDTSTLELTLSPATTICRKQHVLQNADWVIELMAWLYKESWMINFWNIRQLKFHILCSTEKKNLRFCN